MSVKINEELLGPRTENGLACPFAKADPERYATQASCRPGRGWSKVGDIAEHVWRFHSPRYRCEYCGLRWTGVRNHKNVTRHRDEHMPACREQNDGVQRPPEPTDVEILSEEQQSEFERVLMIRDNEKKFAALYRACGKPEPETYHVKPLAPSQTSTNNSSLLDGFTRPDADPQLQPQQQQPLISKNRLKHVHKRSQVNDVQPLTPSGAVRPPDQDSGYYSKQQDTKTDQSASNNSVGLEQTSAKVETETPLSAPEESEVVLTPSGGSKVDISQKSGSKADDKNTPGPRQDFSRIKIGEAKKVEKDELATRLDDHGHPQQPLAAHVELGRIDPGLLLQLIELRNQGKKRLGSTAHASTSQADLLALHGFPVKEQDDTLTALEAALALIYDGHSGDGSATRDDAKSSTENLKGESSEINSSKDIAEVKVVEDGGNGLQEGLGNQAVDDVSEVASLASVSDLMSLFSEQPSLTSDTTYSSLGSPLDVADATDELVQLLLLDEQLGRLLSSGFQRTGAADKIERNYTRLLRHFATDLREESKSPVEQHVARLVKFRARFISQTLVAAVDPMKSDRTTQMEALLQQGEERGERIEGYLLSLDNDFVDPSRLGINSQLETLLPQDEEKGDRKKLIKRAVDSDDDSSDESDDENNRPNLSQLRAFILSSNALVSLRTRFKNFLSPEPEPEIPAQRNEHTKEIDGRTASVESAPEISTKSKDQAVDVDRRVSDLEIWLQKLLFRWKFVDQETVSAFFEATLHFFRPRIPKGHHRITWVCGCGKPMYSDVQELHDGGAAHLEQKLRRAAAAAAAKSRTQSSANNTTTQRQGTGGSNSSSGSAISGSTLAPHSGIINTAPGPSSGSTQNGNPSLIGLGSGPPEFNRFLILCVNGPSLARYQHLSVLSGVDDQVLFQDIRRSYTNLRRDVVRSFHPDTPVLVQKVVNKMDSFWSTSQKLTTDLFKWLKLGWLVWWLGNDVFFIPKSAQFVRFQLVPVKMDITPRILECCLPPREEVEVKHNYHYAPCPPDVRDQTLGLPFLHVLLEPGNHLDDFWTNHMPKKLRKELEYKSGPDPVIGWGVHIIEGPNWHALAVLTIVFVAVSLILALVYSFVTSDVSSAFTLGSFVLAAETLVVTLVLTVIVTSISQHV